MRFCVDFLLYCHLQHHNNTMIKTQEDFFINICTSHFIVRVRKGLLKVCVWEGVGDRTETSIFWPPLLWPARILSATSLDLNSSGPQGPFGLMWLSLPHLVYNSVRSLTATHQRLQEPLRPDVAFPTTSRL